MQEPPPFKPPAKPAELPQADAELRRVKAALWGIGGTAHMILGSILVLFSEPPEFGPHPWGVVGGLFFLYGVVQKLFALRELSRKR